MELTYHPIIYLNQIYIMPQCRAMLLSQRRGSEVGVVNANVKVEVYEDHWRVMLTIND
jgi:hypothetical protein